MKSIVFRTWNAYALTGLRKKGELTHRALPYVNAITLSGLKNAGVNGIYSDKLEIIK